MTPPETRYAKSGDVHIAYQVLGSGPIDLVFVPGFGMLWKNPADGQWLRSCTIITTDANELIAPIHDRMPVILDSDDWPAWLGEVPANDNELMAMLRPYPSERLAMWPVDRRVGNVRNEGPQLAEPVAVAAP